MHVTGTVSASVLLCNFLYWCGKEKHPELGIFKSHADLMEETGLSEKQIKGARARLRELGVLQETHKRLEHRVYYRVDMDVLEERWTAFSNGLA